MATTSKSDAAALTFEHPSAGTSRADPSILAIRWRDGIAAETRHKLLDAAGVQLLRIGSPDRAPLVQANQTEGLSWVHAKDGASIALEAIARLERSEAVEWVMPALRPAAARSQARLADDVAAHALFTVNPTRFYLREAAIDQAGGAAALAPGLSVGASGASGAQRLRGWVTVQVDAASFTAGRTAPQLAAPALQALNLAAGAAAGAVRYETIPLLSPAAHAHAQPAHPGGGQHGGGRASPQGELSCRPPISAYEPDDPLFAQQWGLQRIGVPRGWQIARGSPEVTVAVIDQGVELGHPDLLLHPMSWNASSDLPDGGPVGDHGTPCAGIIGARMDNGLGGAGVAPGVRVMAIATSTWADADIAEGLYFAADQGARVVSMSFGVYDFWNAWDFDLIRDALQYAHDRGLLLVAASGNEDWNLSRFPGSDARTLCVGGSNRADERKRSGDASLEPFWGASFGPDVDVVAPCLEIVATDRLGAAGYTADDYTTRFNGTSSATPLVAGLGALLLSLRPSMDAVEARSLIERSCDKISPALYPYASVAGKPSGTWHEEVGYGRVNVERTLLEACKTGCACDDAACGGCGGRCEQETPAACRGPAPVPWLAFDRCMVFYEARIFDGGSAVPAANTAANDRQRLRLRVSYEHCLRLVGRQQGPLLYTTTLLPGEKVKLYEYDRFRRTRAETQRVSVHTSMRQTLSALSQSRRSTASSAYMDTLVEIRAHADTSIAAGGGLAGFLGAPTVKGESGVESETTVASGGSVRTASEQFSQLAITASQAMEAERSLVVSSFEEQEHLNTTARELSNHNHCYAVTYYVRRVNEVYEAHSRIVSTEWRLGDAGPWRDVADTAGLPEALRKQLLALLKDLLKDGKDVRDGRQITVPTDGTVYEAELAHCASCEPGRMAEESVRVERLRLQAQRLCLENQLLELEIERRKAAGAALEVGPWPLAPMASAVEAVPH
ncbi:MAG TPA: S8 family serine peptidase [Methylibium sp.]|uniref:S8 family serine peptidase n=1 Tax=Methylibium sp. TaxID=2067992 RepID=UPI002DB7917F|nr:S8 family serine peptidase [Methylibium sp.]HEU4460807.1 S8 family serine peptidase [Methylibium sp.]